MKIGIFTDSHYSSQELTCGNRHNSQSLRKIGEAMAYFEQQKCDLVVCLGDLIDREEEHALEVKNLTAAAKLLEDFSVPCLCVMGNHDGFAFTEEEFYAILGEERRPHTICEGEKNLLFIDACYFKNGVHYMPGDSDWRDTFFPFEEALRKKLATLTGDTALFMHQNIDPNVTEEHCLYNAASIRQIIHESGIVKWVCQGHYHPGQESVHDGIRYMTYPAMCENENAFFLLEI